MYPSDHVRHPGSKENIVYFIHGKGSALQITCKKSLGVAPNTCNILS